MKLVLLCIEEDPGKKIKKTRCRRIFPGSKIILYGAIFGYDGNDQATASVRMTIRTRYVGKIGPTIVSRKSDMIMNRRDRFESIIVTKDGIKRRSVEILGFND